MKKAYTEGEKGAFQSVQVYGLKELWERRQAEREGFPRRHPDQETRKRREISAAIAMTLSATLDKFDELREGVYSLMRTESLAAGHTGVCFTAEAKTLRNAPSLRDRAVRARLVASAEYLLRTLDQTGEIDWPAVDAQMRLLDYLTARPWCEVRDGKVQRIELPKRAENKSTQGEQ